MVAKSNIEWTQFTWSPATGCTKISPGCKHCYAETMAERLQAIGAPGYENCFKLTLHPDRLKQPLKRKKPALYFVSSMSDMFHENIPFGYLDHVFDTIRATPQHTYQILTKRPERMEQYFQTRTVPANAWLGTTVEDREYGLPRIDVLRRINATTRFLSIEPLLEDLGTFDLNGIHWVIVGGESGPNTLRRAQPLQRVEKSLCMEQKQCRTRHILQKQARICFRVQKWQRTAYQ